LGANVERVEAEVAHALERAPQDVARVALVGRAVGRHDVADHPGDLRLALLPGHHLEGVGIGDCDHVRLLDRVEPGDRRAVEAHPVVERVLDFARGDREALEMSLDVGEPEEQELDPLVLDPGEHLLPRLRIACRPRLALDLRHALLPSNTKAPDASAPEAASPTNGAQSTAAAAGSSSSPGSRPWCAIARP